MMQDDSKSLVASLDNMIFAQKLSLIHFVHPPVEEAFESFLFLANLEAEKSER